MATFDVAHINEQGFNLVIAFVNGPVSDDMQLRLQRCAKAAGLVGTVVPAWNDGLGTWQYRAPLDMLVVLGMADWDKIVASINGQLSCG
jgi:hypothetical protein